MMTGRLPVNRAGALVVEAGDLPAVEALPANQLRLRRSDATRPPVSLSVQRVTSPVVGVERVDVGGERALASENARSRLLRCHASAPSTPVGRAGDRPQPARRRVEQVQLGDAGFVDRQRERLAVLRQVEALDVPLEVGGERRRAAWSRGRCSRAAGTRCPCRWSRRRRGRRPRTRRRRRPPSSAGLVSGVFWPFAASTSQRVLLLIDVYSPTSSGVSSGDQSSACQPPPVTCSTRLSVFGSAGFMT